jgi:lycopene cyclase domain-containing protein
MTGLVYLLCLLVPLACMAVLDRRSRLVLWRAPRRGAVVLAAGIGLFLLWDLAAIAAGHYRMGQSPLMTGILLGPELPLEELVFIAFLSYHALVLWGLVHLGLGRLGAGRAGPRPGGRRAGPASAPPREVP